MGYNETYNFLIYLSFPKLACNNDEKKKIIILQHCEMWSKALERWRWNTGNPE